MDSASAQRTANNVMRHEYRELSAAEKETVRAIKDAGLALVEVLEASGSSREISLAKTKAEEAVMWGVKHVTR